MPHIKPFTHAVPFAWAILILSSAHSYSWIWSQLKPHFFQGAFLESWVYIGCMLQCFCLYFLQVCELWEGRHYVVWSTDITLYWYNAVKDLTASKQCYWTNGSIQFKIQGEGHLKGRGMLSLVRLIWLNFFIVFLDLPLSPSSDLKTEFWLCLFS